MPGAAATNLLIGEKAIQAAILLYGAVVASFAVYPEFLTYRQGIYRARQFNEQTRLGTHAVQLLGWGANPSSQAKYWIAENSWGIWGENQDFQLAKERQGKRRHQRTNAQSGAENWASKGSSLML